MITNNRHPQNNVQVSGDISSRAINETTAAASSTNTPSMRLGHDAMQQSGGSMSQPSNLPLSNSHKLTGATPGGVPLVKISMDDANATLNARQAAYGQPVDAGSKKYQGVNTTNQALRWISSLGLHGTKGAVEVQATVHNGKLLISSNKNTEGLLEGLKSSFNKLDQTTGNERYDRHCRNISEKLLNDEGFDKFKGKALKRLKETPDEPFRRPVSKQDSAYLKSQVGPTLDTIRHAATALKNGNDEDIRKYVQVVDSKVHPDLGKSRVDGASRKNEAGKACLHAEQSLYDHLAENASASATSHGPLLIPVAGVKRPCAVCDHVEHSAGSLQNSPFGKNGHLYLHRASERPGVVFPGMQGISQGAVGKENVEQVISNLLSGDINAQSRPVISQSTDTDSESDS